MRARSHISGVNSRGYADDEDSHIVSVRNRGSAGCGDGVKGIGVVQRDKADPQFVLAPGASGDATFTLS